MDTSKKIQGFLCDITEPTIKREEWDFSKCLAKELNYCLVYVPEYLKFLGAYPPATGSA